MPENVNQEFFETFGRRVRSLRKEKGVTMEELSEKTGILLRQISRIEKGRVNTTINSARAIAKVLEIEVSQMFESK